MTNRPIDFATARRNMVDSQIRPSDVTDIALIDALRRVPREAFVPDDLKPIAYLDRDILLAGAVGRTLALLRPVFVARMLQAAGITPTSRVLVVGCGTGYVAAVAAHLADHVTATVAESDAVADVSANLVAVGCAGVAVVRADNARGAPQNAPYDVIVLGGACEVELADVHRQLADEGRLVGIFGSRPQRAMIIRKAHGEVGSQPLFDATAPVLAGLAQPAEFRF